MAKKIVISDIDGTVANHSKRLDKLLITRDFEAFYNHQAMLRDTPLPLLKRLNALPPDTELIFITGRRVSSHEATQAWLGRYVSRPFRFLMERGSKDHRPNFKVKLSLLAKLFAYSNGGEDVTFFEDDPKTLKAVAEAYPLFNCVACEFKIHEDDALSDVVQTL